MPTNLSAVHGGRPKSGHRAWSPCQRPVPVQPSLPTTPQIETVVCRMLARTIDAERNGTELRYEAGAGR